MTKLVNGNGEKDVTNDMRRVVSGKTDSLNSDSHNKHLDICLFFHRIYSEKQLAQGPSFTTVSSCDLICGTML